MEMLSATKPDIRAVSIAQQIHKVADAEQTFLFGSRARGDHRPDSDIDVVVVKEEPQTESWLEDLQRHARDIQKTQMPEASGIDVICMTKSEFNRGRVLRNHMANTIAKEGYPTMPDEGVGYGTDYADERIDWDDVDKKIIDATGAATWINAIRDAGIIDVGDDLQLGRVAQNALEFAYKAVLGAHGCAYPVSGRDGHNLRILTDLLRENQIIGADELAPGENHRYLTEFGGGAVYAREHPPLDRRLIAREIPQAVAQLRTMVDDTRHS
ncbi:MAG: nucleotidyltransferase domain-containing protein [Chloroflexota bacterium]|nr:nucleotidyltransferase domain-containing protein [Chloroflexota bacterium]MDE2960837.1 nucleotidyltransferase domain-containing protein [Chloroflexota bacterium]